MMRFISRLSSVLKATSSSTLCTCDMQSLEAQLTVGLCLFWKNSLRAAVWVGLYDSVLVCEQTDKLWLFLSLGRFTNSCAKTCVSFTNQLNQVQCALLNISVESLAILKTNVLLAICFFVMINIIGHFITMHTAHVVSVMILNIKNHWHFFFLFNFV